MRLSVIITLATALSFTACTYKSSHSESSTDKPVSPPAPRQEGPFNLLSGNTTSSTSRGLQVEQAFAAISLAQINSAKVSQIKFPDSVPVPKDPDIRIELEYEKADKTGIAVARYPAVYGDASKIDGTNLILPGLRFNVPPEVNAHSRKQTLRVSAAGLEVIIPLKTPRLAFCTKPFAAEMEFRMGALEKDSTTAFKQINFWRHTTDLTLENLVTCGLTITGDRFDHKNPIQELQITSPTIEIYLDGQQKIIDVDVPQYDGSQIYIKFPAWFAPIPVGTMEVRAVDPSNSERYASFAIHLVPTNN